MSKRYGGEYSPQNSQDNRRRGVGILKEVNPPLRKALRRLKTYRNLGFAIAATGLAHLMAGSPFVALASFATAFGVILSSEITKAGVEADEAYKERTIARAPAYPRKLIGAVVMGVSLALACKVSVGTDWLSAIGVGLIAGIGMMMSFGLDPMRSKGLQGMNRYEAGRAAEAIERAQSMLDEIRALSKNLPDRKARLEVESLAMSAEDMFRALEGDPADYRNSRRYLGVYLQGARDATAQFLQLPKSEQSAESEAKYLALIRELDEGFRQKSETILNDNRNTLDIEIDVLRERLASEGIKIPEEEKS